MAQWHISKNNWGGATDVYDFWNKAKEGGQGGSSAPQTPSRHHKESEAFPIVTHAAPRR